MKLAACIVETRPIANLADIILAHIKHLPVGTDLYIFYGPDNANIQYFLPEATSFELKENLTIEKYNNLLTTSDFWFNFGDYDRVLIFQSDSMILRPGIEAFYMWDYCGAEWPFFPFCGNGGFSLRNPKLMHNICVSYPYNPSKDGQEDTYFCNHMHLKNLGKLAPPEECRKFSVESQASMGSFGYHAIEKWLTPEQCIAIKSQYVQ